ncbi:hypothetical protein AURDEDRAFT_116091 [Auricularia subglabra TFB-10046 SS5]|uniref:Nudix hydrolase domain-containing protein n=1 Tax=Auricularia subglabra (strain TFB-10046 / SS5) TaxID=717982 RepID=J0D1B6_AURST|nr:hypothetical protein AURDEDRAFT_116091 [Auricularia subglabra TFB-10046 SS5]
MGFWSASDFSQETGAVVIDRRTERVLFIFDEPRQMYTLPRSKMDNIEALMQSPLDSAQTKSGLRCSRLLLPRLAKRYIVPPDKNWDNVRAKTAYMPSQLTTDPFYVSFNTQWEKIEGVNWPDGYQVLTYWYGGIIDVDADSADELAPLDEPESQRSPYQLLPIQAALSRLEGKDAVAHGALSMFSAIWFDARKLLEHKQ